MPFSNEIRAGASGAQSTDFYNGVTSRSLRFEKDDSSYLSFTQGTATDISKWTVNFWFKTEAHTSSYADDYVTLWGVNGPGTTSFSFIDGDLHFYLNYNTGGSQIVLRSNRKFRDVGQWYNFHVKFDRAQGTAANRLKIFVNGIDLDNEGGYSTDERSNIASDSSSGWNVSGQTAAIGRRSGDNNSRYVSGTLAYFHNVDGQYLDATNFIDIKKGICVPKLYSGSYGNNGWKLEFLQTGTGTASSSTIGADTSGNNNHWTSNSLASTDIMLDHPENNFAVQNSLFAGTSVTYKQGNLKVGPFGSLNSSTHATVSTFAIPKDKKIYIEVECTDDAGNLWTAGFATESSIIAGPGSTNIGGSGSIFEYNRSVIVNGTENDYGSSAGLGGLGVSKLAAGDILGCMIDGATGKVWFSRNGVYFKTPTTNNSGTTGDPDGGNHEIGTITGGTTDDVFFVVNGSTTTDDLFINFGQDSVNVASANADANGIGTFEYAPPTDYVCLCAANLTDPDIGPTQSQQADDHFNTVLYTGDGASSNSITGVGFQPDWLWIKNRLRSSISHVLVDSVRGLGDNGVNLHTLISNNDDPEFDQSDADGVSSLNADGFTVGYTNSNAFNLSTDSYVAWNWKAGGTAVSNGNGTITSNVSANQDAGFSIVSFTGNSTNPSTIGHGLSQAPEYIIYKSRDATNGTWYVSSDDIGWTHRLKLDTTASRASSTALWNDTAPTNSVFTISSSLNYNGDAIIAYCFHSVLGYSKVGSYKGGGSSLLPFIHTGFRPAWVLLKVSTATNNWFIYDNKREGYNEDNDTLSPNEDAVEDNSYKLDLVSNGFKIRGTQNAHNQSGQTFVYLAFAEAPFKFTNAR